MSIPVPDLSAVTYPSKLTSIPKVKSEIVSHLSPPTMMLSSTDTMKTKEKNENGKREYCPVPPFVSPLIDSSLNRSTQALSEEESRHVLLNPSNLNADTEGVLNGNEKGRIESFYEPDSTVGTEPLNHATNEIGSKEGDVSICDTEDDESWHGED